MKKGAFSLIELMIVIVIMGVIYTMSVRSFPTETQKVEEKLSLLNLKEYLKGLEYEKTARIICLDDCQSCDIVIDGEINSTIENFVDDSIHVYRYSYLQGEQEVVKEAYFNERDVQEHVCFSYGVDKKGVGDQVLIEYKNAAYDFTRYLEPTQKYASLEEAVDAKSNLIEEVKK